MKSGVEDLSALDRTTIRVWRASNLLGWGLAGAVAGVATFVIAARLVGGLASQMWSPPALRLAALGTAVAFAGVVDGTIVGGHVYRWPGRVAAASFLVPSLLVLLGVAVASPAEIALLLAIPAAGAAVAAVTARRSFRRRPRALRAPEASRR